MNGRARCPHRAGFFEDEVTSRGVVPEPTPPYVGVYCSLKLSVPQLSTLNFHLLIEMHDLRGREAVEIGRGGVTVGANLFAVQEITQLQIAR
jgi:hypothetical protein